jgi:hypothetical protein
MKAAGASLITKYVNTKERVILIPKKGATFGI